VGAEHSRRARAVPGAMAAVVLGGILAGASQAGASQAGAAAVPAGTITTIAGGVGGPAKATTVAVSPCGARFAGGSLYVGDIAAIRQISPASDQLTTPVGTGSTTPLGDGGPATSAGLNGSCTAVPDPAGNLVVADTFDNLIRAVAATTGTFYGRHMTAGDIYTVAGNGTFGFSGDGGPATGAELRYPQAVAVDGAGNLVIADTHNNRIRVVAEKTGTFYGRAMTAGDIYTVAGGGKRVGDGGPATTGQLNTPQNVTTDGAGNLVIADTFQDRIRVVAEKTGTLYGRAMTAGDIYTVAGTGTQGFSGDGGAATQAELGDPNDVVTDGAGNLVIADTSNSRIRVVAASTGTFYGRAMTAGDIYTVAGTGIAGFSGNGGPATSAEINEPQGVTVDGPGNLVIADSMNDRVRVVAASTGTFYTKAMTAGDIYTIAGNGTIQSSGDGGPATAAELFAPEGVAVDGAGNVVIADTSNSRIRVAAASTGTFYGQPMTSGGIYTVAGSGKRAFSGDGGPAAKAALRSPYGIASDSAGDLLIADTFNSRARMVAASTGTFFGQAMTAGNIYTIAGDGLVGFAGDGGPATDAKLGKPEGTAMDGAGNLVIADTSNNRVRVVAGGTGTFYGQAMTTGDIYTVAGNGVRGYSGNGGPASGAEMTLPQDVTVDGAGNLVIADTGNAAIRVVAVRTARFYGRRMIAGAIYTVAGNGSTGFSGDGGPATGGELADPSGVAVDGPGNLVIADLLNFRVRVVAESTGTFYGIAMTAGDIYTVAGDGTFGFSGDGGPATSAALGYPDAVAADGTSLVFADQNTSRIRQVTG
jgi:trimeric autotransporter adhesin